MYKDGINEGVFVCVKYSRLQAIEEKNWNVDTKSDKRNGKLSFFGIIVIILNVISEKNSVEEKKILIYLAFEKLWKFLHNMSINFR